MGGGAYGCPCWGVCDGLGQVEAWGRRGTGPRLTRNFSLTDSRDKWVTWSSMRQQWEFERSVSALVTGKQEHGEPLNMMALSSKILMESRKWRGFLKCVYYWCLWRWAEGIRYPVARATGSGEPSRVSVEPWTLVLQDQQEFFTAELFSNPGVIVPVSRNMEQR